MSLLRFGGRLHIDSTAAEVEETFAMVEAGEKLRAARYAGGDQDNLHAVQVCSGVAGGQRPAGGGGRCTDLPPGLCRESGGIRSRMRFWIWPSIGGLDRFEK